jgi:hypothetical protein
MAGPLEAAVVGDYGGGSGSAGVGRTVVAEVGDCGGGTGSCRGGRAGAAAARLKQCRGRIATATEGAGLAPALLEGLSAHLVANF